MLWIVRFADKVELIARAVEMGPYLTPNDGNGNGMRVGYTVDDSEHGKEPLVATLPLLQHADLEDKVVLLRVDHNVVKKGPIHCHLQEELGSTLEIF